MNWQPISEAKIAPFDPDSWPFAATPTYLLWSRGHATIGRYGYTQKGKGRWQSIFGICEPTHFCEIKPPEGL